MTTVEFHVNVPDALAYGCRLVRKAVRANAKRLVLLLDTPDQVRALDGALWAMAPGEFLPHCTCEAPEAVQRRSPVLIFDASAWTRQAEPPVTPILVNLGTEVPVAFERSERLIEIVTAAEREAARRRWRHYAGRGYQLKSHDLARGAVK